jgi:hypothetical protein
VRGLLDLSDGPELMRDEIAMRRESLRRHTGHDDNLVVVKMAQSARASA